MNKLAALLATLLFILFSTACSKNPQPQSSDAEMSSPSDFVSVSESQNSASHTPDSTANVSSQPSVSASSGSAASSETSTGSQSSVAQSTPSKPQPTLPDGKAPIAPKEYQKLLQKGMDVDWSKTSDGKVYYNTKAVTDFKAAGVHHVRIRVKDKADDTLFSSLDKQVDDCIKNGVLPIIAYQADEFKNDPSQKNIDKVVKWWGTVAQRYQDKSHLLAFDMLIEATDALNSQPEKLNEIYEAIVTEIRKTNPTRIVMMSPRLRSDAAYLHELTLPTEHNGYIMAQWHFYASGPAKDNDRKLWTTGTDGEKQLILDKINLALQWQKNTGIPTWVGAWMPGNYNDGNDYTIAEQCNFAAFMTKSLTDAGIPFAVNSDTKFYSRETGAWVSEMAPVFKAIYG